MSAIGFICKRKYETGIYGVVHAEKELLNAIIKYSSWEKIIVWTEESLDFCNHKVIVKNIRTIVQDIKFYSINIIHHVGIGSSEFSGLHKYFDGIIVTSVYPALSYHQQISEHLSDLIFNKPDDVSIYPSHCSRQVANNIKNKLSSILNIDLGKRKSKVIPIGVDLEIFSPLKEVEKECIFDEEGIETKYIICSILTRFSPSDKSDILPLIHSIAYNENIKKSELKFILFGGDNYYGAKQYISILNREIDRLKISNIVKVLTINDRKRVVDLLRGSDIFLSPVDSVQETYGITPLEAMACEAVPVVSDWNGYKETVVDNVVGFKAPTTFYDNTDVWKLLDYSIQFRDQHLIIGQSVFVDTDFMVEKCLFLHENKDILTKMQQAARSHVEKHYSWENIIREYEAVWSDKKRDACKPECLERKIDYWSVFYHYATNLSSDLSLYIISSYGSDVRAGSVIFSIFSGLQDIISMDIVELILELSSKKPISVSMITKTLNVDVHKIRFHISFLHKQGLLIIYH